MTIQHVAIRIANKKYDGHFTMMKFTTNYSFCFGTVAWSPDLDKWYESVGRMYRGATPDEAMLKAIRAEPE